MAVFIAVCAGGCAYLAIYLAYCIRRREAEAISSAALLFLLSAAGLALCIFV